MKFIYLLLTVIFLNSYSVVFSQQITYSGKNVPLKTVFSTIQKQTGYGFFYDPALLTETKPLTLTVQNAPLSEVLAIIFKNQPLEYSIENKTILVSKKKITNNKAAKPKVPPVDQAAEPAKSEDQKTTLNGAMPDKKADSSSKVSADTLTLNPGKSATMQSTLTTPGSTDASGLPADSPEPVKPQSGQTISNLFKFPEKPKNTFSSKALSPAQGQRISLGFKGGLNKSTINATDNDGSKSGYTGLELYGGFFADTRLTSKFNLGTELLFSFTESFHFIELPLHLKYTINEKWNAMAGPKLDFIADGSWDYQEDKFKRFGVSAEIGSQYRLNQLFFVELKYANGLTPQINSRWMSFYDGRRNTIRLGLGLNFGKNEAFGKVSKDLGPMRLRAALNAGTALTSGYDIVIGGDLRIQKNISSATTGMLTLGYNHYSLKSGFIETNIAYFPVKAGLKFFPASGLYIAPEAGIAIGTKSEAFTYPIIYAAGIGTETKNGFDISLRYEKMTGRIYDYLDEIKRPVQLALRVEYGFNLNSGKAKSGEFSAVKEEAAATGKLKKSVFVEFLGNGPFISGNFDMRLKPDRNDGLGLRAGAGFINNYITVPLGLNYILGKRRSGFETGIGITPIVRIGGGQDLSGDLNGPGFDAAGFLNAGYRLQSRNGFMLRANVSAAYADSYFLFGWPGISIGYSFK
jgi:hypothetical protein